MIAATRDVNMKIKIKHKITGEVLFSHSCENNTFRKTILKAIKEGIKLSYADLSYTDLSYTNLSNAALSNTNLSNTNLSYTNLSNADLSNTDLSYTNLSYTNLSYTNLSNADLRYTIGNAKEIKTIQTSKWMIVMTEKVMAMGCEQHKFKKWMKFTDSEISEMDCNALEFWNNWKKIIKKMHKLGFET